MTARLIAAVDRVDARERTASHGKDRLLSFANILPEDEAFVDLIDWPRIFPKVWGLLGWNIYVYHTHLDVSPPLAEPPARPVAWHQDSMRVNEEIECHPRPRLSLKIGYYLTDVSGPDWGNTLLLPASHLSDELDCPNDGVSCRRRAPSRCASRPGPPCFWTAGCGTRAAPTSGRTRARSSGSATPTAGFAPRTR